MLRRIFLAALFAFAFASFGNVVRADTIQVAGAASGNLATATVVCEFNSQTNTFTFTITNTSAITSPGSTATITAIGFDLPPDGNASDSGLNGFTGMQAPSLSSDFDFSDADLGTVPGFDDVVLDFGFITGKNFAGGKANSGLAPGESASFTVSGAAFAGFTEEQICEAIFVRFQRVGADGEGSDVGVPAQTGRIVIIAQAAPESAQVFSFSGTNGIGNFALVDDGVDNDATPNNIAFDLAAGPYTVSLTDNGPYLATNFTCSVFGFGGSTASPNIPASLISFDLRAGDTVTCTYFNSIVTSPF